MAEITKFAKDHPEFDVRIPVPGKKKPPIVK